MWTDGLNAEDVMRVVSLFLFQFLFQSNSSHRKGERNLPLSSISCSPSTGTDEVETPGMEHLNNILWKLGEVEEKYISLP